ncbi:MAG: PIN domain-containing protein [Anaerolineae bacterium]|nr:PIN domain-containing protein [Anaerolineae bacterium]
MNRVFVDASVLFSAIQSPTGHARDLLRLSLSQAVTLVVSSYVLDEVRVNLARKAPLE